MNYTLIMLDKPILVSEKLTIEEANFISHYQDVDGNFFKIIAGLPDLPKLDLSLIADGIGWVDVEKLANDHIYSMQNRKLSPLILGAKKLSFIDGFKTHQSLNEKKYSEKDIRDAFIAGQDNIDCDGDCIDEVDTAFAEHIDSLSKLKEHQVEVEMEQYTINYHKDLWSNRIKITNNTIKVLKILK